MAILFSENVKHGAFEFLPNVTYGFEDPDAEDYFAAMGWGAVSNSLPVRVYTQDEVSIDPLTRIAETGKFVLPEHPAVIEHGGDVIIPVGDRGAAIDVHNVEHKLVGGEG